MNSTRHRTIFGALGVATCLTGSLLVGSFGCARDRTEGGTAATEAEQREAAKVKEPTRQDIPPAPEPGRIRPM